MHQPERTQNVTENERHLQSLSCETKRIDKHESTLERILTQQNTNQSHLQELGNMVCAAN